MSFTFAEPRHLWLEISPTTQTAAWQVSQQLQASGARWQVYLNQLCVHACLRWFQTDISPTAMAWPALNANPVSWEVVMGSCICFDSVKLVLIPTDTVGQEALEVPQEWVDIPGWAADYYLAVKVNPDEGWVEIWGYVTHRQLKINGEYDTWERIYSVDSADLVSDISALWTTLERCPTIGTQAESSTESALQSELSASQADNLIAQLAKSDVAFPRLSVPFAQWGALLADETWRQRLYIQRLAALKGEVEVSAGIPLSQCLQEIQGSIQAVIATGWQSIEAVFGAEAQQLAFGFRQDEQAEGRQAKVIQFDSNHQSIRLVLLWQLEPDKRLVIRAQLYPAQGELHLPPNITFVLVSDQGAVLQSIRSGEENNFIQLKRFRCPSGYAFRIEMQLGDQKITERFIA